ncbi:hypothetical protein [Anaerococcus tetradius]|uniref:hypothetical protein n=1 Tax=Anaerococcus tetradius TaxID=33036 RepID=UPI0023F43AF7|nr:hypothetical protein [Anaerococcus tetradius]
MKINPNLYVGPNKIQLIPTKLNYNYYRLFYKDIGCEIGQEYTLSFDSEQTINGSGQITILFLDKYANTIRSCIYNSGKRQSITFIYGLNGEERLNIYSDIAGKDANIGLTIFNFKLENGKEETVYNPNINSLEPSKQAVFLTGGVFQEVYPL